MEILFKIQSKDIQKAKDAIYKDEIVSKASIVFKDAKALGLKESYFYCYVYGLEEACKRSKEIMKDLGSIISSKDKDKIIRLIKEEEETAIKGFGNIFG